MAHTTDADIIEKTHNTPRFFVEHRQIAGVLLLGTVLWGWYGYNSMPQRKDPDLPVRVAVALTPWPGVKAQEVEQLVTRPIEETIAENSYIHPATAADYGIRSITLPGLSIIYVQLAENVSDTKKQFSDINLKLNALNGQLPQGAGPIQFQSDFGDTAALMLTVASPRLDEVEIAIRARILRSAVEEARKSKPGKSRDPRVSAVYCFPQSVSPDAVRREFDTFSQLAQQDGVFRDVRLFAGPGYIGLDGSSAHSDPEIRSYIDRYIHERLHVSEFHPDAWGPVLIHDTSETAKKMAAVAGDKYSYRELDDFTDLIARTLIGAPQASKYQRAGVLSEQVYLDYSQERLANYGVQPSRLQSLLQARNIALPGGVLEVGQKNVIIDPSGEFQSAKSIGDVIIGASSSGSPVYLRDLVEISRGYQSPAKFLNYYTWCDSQGIWQRSRAVTVAIFMRSGEQISRFGKNIDEKLAAVRQILPADLMIVRTSDQPRQVKENIDLFMDALYEAIALVILVSLLGFWEWRSAVLMAFSIPITLAMTFGFAYILGIDLQQVSIATLIIALGLLVDDPVVAGDAIKRSLAEGQPSLVSAWLGPTKLAKAIMFATITNIAAYLPFLMLTGNTGNFLYSLPIVMACALVSSRLVSMTFIPLLGYYFLRRSNKPEQSLEERRKRGFIGFYARVATLAIEHRWKVLAGSFVFLLIGFFAAKQLRSQFFPDDVQYWATVDIWLPNDAPLSATSEAAQYAEDSIRQAAGAYGREHPGKDGKPRQVLHSLTTFVGGGGPRFWVSVSPEMTQLNYAQIILEVDDKEDTPTLVGPLQAAVSSQVPGARIEVKQLQTNPVEQPVQVMISSQADVAPDREPEDIRTLRALSGKVEDIFRAIPKAVRVHNDWDEESTAVRLEIDPDRANLAGVTNSDVAASTTAALSGTTVMVMREGNKQIPVVARLRMEERAQLSDIQNLYVYSSQSTQKVPLIQISSIKNDLESQRIRRQEHFRTISVECAPASGALSSEILSAAMPKLLAFQASLPAGYKMIIGGENAKQVEGFRNLAIVMGISIAAIFLALVLQFNHAVKPLLVFAAVPYGIVGALLALFVTGTPFGFMAFLGIASLIGVIVSHVIVLFDFIEEMHEKGEPMKRALVDAGIARLRPVLITVGATVLALFPLALHGGPLWKPLCYSQIGGLGVATFITLLLVPVFYSIFVLDLKLVHWEGPTE
ncbi:MAG: efflux RND transporter permease subunit [Candidatus Acidiferrales bacterium]